MKKKGIMLDFLVALLLSLILFVPACVFVSNFFKADNQAKDSFLELAKLVKKVGESQDSTSSFMLIMEPGTAIVGFAKDTFQNCYTFEAGYNKGVRCEIWDKPTDSECKTSSCLCLITEFKKQTLAKKVNPDKVTCYNVGKVQFSIPKSKAGTIAKDYQAVYQITQIDGFLIARDITYSLVNFVEPLEVSARRTPIYLVKKEKNLFICLDAECREIDRTYQSTAPDIPLK